MKHKSILFLSILLFWSQQELFAQEEPKPLPNYIYLNYGMQKFKSTKTDLYTITYDYAAAFTAGRTYYLHTVPFLNMVRFGIDWTYIDLNFAGYSVNLTDDDYDWNEWNDGNDWEDDWDEEDNKFRHFQLEIGMQVGPSVTVTPLKDFRVNAYFRYAPSVSALLSDLSESVTASYGNFFVSGINLSYKKATLGVERRWGTGKYKFETEDEDSYGYYEYSEKLKMKTSGIRIFLGIRF